MRAIPSLLLFALPLAVFAAEVRPGDSLIQVREVLGSPRGQVRASDRLVLYYDRGEVVLRQGAVASVSLLSDAEVTARDERREAAEERAREEAAKQLVAGQAEMERQLASAAFRAAPASYQVAYWQDFARRYPGVGVAEPLAAARVLLVAELEQKLQRDEQAARIADLEARVAAAEARADAAESYVEPFSRFASYGGYRWERRGQTSYYQPIIYRLTDGGYTAQIAPQPVPRRSGSSFSSQPSGFNSVPPWVDPRATNGFESNRLVTRIRF